MLPHMSEIDYREPLFRFSIHPFGGRLDDDSQRVTTAEYGFYFISVTFWDELGGMVFIQMLVAAATGLVLYRTVVQPKRADTSFAFLVGFGAVVPFWVAWPVILIRLFDVRNAIFRFAIGCVTPTLSIFRATECIFGFAPPTVSKSVGHYVFHFASVLLPARDKNGDLIPCPSSMVVRHLRNFLLFSVITGAVQSMLTPYPSFAVFGGAEDWYAIRRFFTWQLYANSAVQARKCLLIRRKSSNNGFCHVLTVIIL
jgi:hypothetical protein